MGVGAGMGFGQMMSGAMGDPTKPQPAGTQTGPATDPLTSLRQLKEMHETGLITDEEYAAKKKEILSRM